MSTLITTPFMLAKQEAISLGNSLRKISMTEFFEHFHGKYYQTIDVSFMDYFLQIIDHEGEFVIPHDKLVEYGITCSTKSNHILRRLEGLDLQDNIDFTIVETISNNQNTNQYFLTPDAFKLCLTKAQRRPDNEVDPKIYNQYYILLEKIYKLFTIYQSTYHEHIVATKDDKIDTLTSEMRVQNEKSKKRSKKLRRQIETQSEQIGKILGYANAITDQTKTLVDNTEYLKITADSTREQLDKNLTYTRQTLLMLEEKSRMSTINPTNPKLITHYAVLVPKNLNMNKTRTILVRGQMSRINTVIAENDDEYTPYVSYSANSINLIINAQARFEEMRAEYITSYNEPIIERNQLLALAIVDHNKEVEKHNRKYPKDKRPLRYLSKEKEVELCIKDIPIKFGRTFISYESNKHICYKDVVNCIETMRFDTQRSPADSFDEAENEALEAIDNVKTSIEMASETISKLPNHIKANGT